MYSLLISIAIGALCAVLAVNSDQTVGMTVFYGFLGFIVSSLVVGLLVRRKLQKVQSGLQEMMAAAQGQINRKVQQFQSKPGGNPKAMQKQLDAAQMALMKEALDYLPNFEPFRNWNILMGRQISTMRFQFLYRLKRFEEVDEVLATGNFFKKPMLMEPVSVAMKMARQYEREDFSGAERTFKKSLRWMRGSRATLLYGTMSWIYVKQNELEKAQHLLATGKDKTKNDTLARNYERLANGNDKKFSNQGLGDEWYALFLEPVRMPKQQQLRGRAAQRQARFQ